MGAFANAFFFSVHTLTTVGYGNVYPEGAWANTISSLEAATGLMVFAIATGLLYGRFSRPSARIIYSKNAIIAPYQDGTSLQFRITNARRNVAHEHGSARPADDGGSTQRRAEAQFHRSAARTAAASISSRSLGPSCIRSIPPVRSSERRAKTWPSFRRKS